MIYTVRETNVLPQTEINLKSQRKIIFENNQAATEKGARIDTQKLVSFLIL